MHAFDSGDGRGQDDRNASSERLRAGRVTHLRHGRQRLEGGKARHRVPISEGGAARERADQSQSGDASAKLMHIDAGDA